MELEREAWAHSELSRNIGKHVRLVGKANRKADEEEYATIEYFIEIDGVKIPSTCGFCKTLEEFEARVETEALTFFEELQSDFSRLT